VNDAVELTTIKNSAQFLCVSYVDLDELKVGIPNPRPKFERFISGE
jgi:hypothetical protein